MVDGTLILLYQKLSYYREIFLDQKCNYSINIQIINMPNQKIINYASKFRDSHHDTHCFVLTKLKKNLLKFLEPYKWYWDDVGYPLQK